MNNRRKLVVTLGAGLLAATLASFARAQTEKMARVGLLGLASASSYVDFLESLRAALHDLGYVEGRNLVLEPRWADGKNERLPGLAAELVRLNVDMIITSQTPASHAAKQATNRIPIVMAPTGDPVGTGLIASLARPGGNITGLSSTTAELAAKNLELIRALSPSAKLIGVLANSSDPFTKPFLAQVELASRTLGLKLHTIMVGGEAALDAAFAELVKVRVDVVIVQGSLPRKPSLDLALKYRLPVVSSSGGFAEAGALMSYTSNYANLHREVAAYVDKILKGANPADLPVQQPNKFELVVNLRTAKALGIRIPNSILARADRIIE